MVDVGCRPPKMFFYCSLAALIYVVERFGIEDLSNF